MIRREPRITLSKDVVLQKEFAAINLSENGMLLQADVPLKVGDVLQLDIDLDGVQQTVEGCVRWVHATHAVFDIPVRAGIQFTDHNVKSLLARRKYLKGLQDKAL